MKKVNLLFLFVILLSSFACSNDDELTGRLHLSFADEDSNRKVGIAPAENEDVFIMTVSVPKDADVNLNIGNYIVIPWGSREYAKTGVQIQPDKTSVVEYTSGGTGSVTY